MKRTREWEFTVDVLKLLRDYPYQGSARPSVILRHYSHVFEAEADMLEESLQRNRRMSIRKIRDMHAPSIGELAVNVQEYVVGVVGNDNLASALNYLLLDDDTQHLGLQFDAARSVLKQSEDTRSRKTAMGCRADYLTFAAALMCAGDTVSKNDAK